MRTLLKTGFTLLVLAFVLIGAGYTALRVNGISAPRNPEGRVVVTEDRTVTAQVTNIDVSGPVNLTLRRGDVPSLSVKGEQRLLANLDTVQDGANLTIGLSGMVLHHRRRIEIDMVLPRLENIGITGSGEHSVNGFSGDKLAIHKLGSGQLSFNGRYADLTISTRGSGSTDINNGNASRVAVEMTGSGTTTVVGSCRELHAELEGSGELNLRDLAAESAALEQRGSGGATLTATREAVVSLAGSGSMDIYGNPPKRNVARTGSGSVVFRD